MKKFKIKQLLILVLFIFIMVSPEILPGKNRTKEGTEKLVSKMETALDRAIEKRTLVRKHYRSSKSKAERIMYDRQLTTLDREIEDTETRIVSIESGGTADWLRTSGPASTGDDAFEDNDTMTQAAQVSAGLYDNLKLYDDDWFKVYVQEGKDLKVSIQGTFGGAHLGDIDVGIYDSTGNGIIAGISGRDSETVYGSDLSAGWYYIHIGYFWDGTLQNIYSLQVQIGTGFGEGKITGRVTDSNGDGIRNIMIRINKLYVDPGPTNWMGHHEAQVHTDVNGNYRVSMTPRNYKIFFYPRATGKNYLNEYYNQKYTHDTADPVPVVANQTTSGIDAQLYEGGTISGNVTDSGAAGIETVYARPFDSDGNRVGTSGRTDENGDYNAYVPTGDVKLMFNGTYRAWRETNYRYEWYNDKAFFPDGDTVAVQGGQTIQNIDAQLADSFGTISGRVTNSSGEGIENVRVTVYETSEIPLFSAYTDDNGDYITGGLPTGNFKLYFYSETLGYNAEWYNNQATFDDAGTVAVTVGQDTPGINAQLSVGSANNPPTVAITEPSDNDTVSGFIDIKTTYSDDYYGLSRFELWWDGDLVVGLNDPNISPGGYDTVLDTSAYSNGSHTIKAYVVDSASQTAEHIITVTVDNPADLPPTVLITNPPGGSTVSGTVTITVDAADDVGVAKVEFYVDDTRIGEDTTNAYEYAWDTSAETNGPHTVKAVAYDTLNQTSEHEVSVTVTNAAGDAPPTISITNPTAGAGVTGMVTVQATAADDTGVTTVKFYVDGTLTGTDNNSPYQVNWDSADFYNGSHTLEAVAYDTAGQTGQHQITVTIANDVDEPPVLHITNLRHSVVSGTINIETRAEDDHGISKTEFYLDDIKMDEQASAECVFTWDTTAYSNQVHYVKMIAYDTSNYRNIARRWVIVHNIGGDSVPEIAETAIGNGAGRSGPSAAGTITIEVTVSDDNGVGKVGFYIDGEKTYEDTTSPYRYQWNTTQYANGDHTVDVVVSDSVGQTVSYQETVNVDNGGDTAPTVTIAGVENNETVSGDLAAAADAKDDNGVVKVEFYVNNSLKLTDTAAPYQYAADTTVLSDGVHSIKAMVYDTMDQTGEHQVFFTVDNVTAAALSVSITSPVDGADVSGTVPIQAEASPAAEVVRVEFYVDGSEVGEDSTAPYSYNWDSSSYAAGSHSIQAVAYGSGSDNAQHSIDVNVTAYSPPVIGLSHSQLNFGYVMGGTAPPAQTVLIANPGTAALNWTAAAGETWIGLSPSSGTGNGILTVSVDPSGMSAGTYTGVITITDPNASNSPQTAAVSLRVYRANGTSAPFGMFATPVDGSTVSSSIAVTGWVLDDIGVESVKIYKEEGQTMVYIGDAIFVEGARPDVEQSYPDYPMNYKAGWGYMMLTNFLPNGGNGTFTIHAKATDTEGKQATLGTKTITCNNADAVKPFGAIDTPLQGGTASGGSYTNYGWVLTPQPNSIPTDGSTVNVYVDGVYLGHPHYDNYRGDIASLFPGYANSDGAVGYFSLDTTAYEDGVHTIFWTAEDTGGNADGIGSRYFAIGNSQGTRAERRGNPVWLPNPGIAADVSNIPVDVTKGYGKEISRQKIYPNDKGIINIEIEELERVVIQLNGENCAGYLMVGDKCKRLPIGSTLDREQGIFYWHPGIGFVGEYRFVFVVKGVSASGITRTDLKITINPGGH